MVFQGSNTPLSEDILKKPREFIKTWVEWASDNFDIISREGSGTIFTVPKNKTFYLTQYHLDAQRPSAAGVAGASFGITGANFDIAHFSFAANLADNQVTSGSYIMPIKVESDRRFLVQVSGGVVAFGIIWGFEIDKRIS